MIEILLLMITGSQIQEPVRDETAMNYSYCENFEYDELSYNQCLEAKNLTK